MCGIVGEYYPRGKADPTVLARMVAQLAHRGPDSGGVWTEGGVGLGHRRLAIIDLSQAAHQPMVSSDGETVISYNGEIYNFLVLRAELEAEGVVFASRSDTEVILWGFRRWGMGRLLARLNGMFAFALWDGRDRRLYLARDRFGAKPLYLWQDGTAVRFSSEIKAFLSHPAFSVKVDCQALGEYFAFQNVLTERTLFAGVDLVPPGTVIEIDGKGLRRRRYWDYDFSHPDDSMTAEDAVEATSAAMATAVERQLVADVPVGAYLSGGLDSGSIVSLASRHIPRLTTFTAGFEMSSVEGIESTFDERRNAEAIAFACRTQQFEQVINAGDIAWALPRLVWHLEDLRLGMSYPNFYVSRLASRFVKVCLSGAGGDELFGGYPWRYYRVFRSLDRCDYLSQYFNYWQRLLPEEQRPSLFQPDIWRDVREVNLPGIFASVFDQNPNASFDTPEHQIANALYFEAKTFLHGLLVVGDKLSMAHGLEERFPFLDNDLVDLAQRIPVRLKLADFEHMTRLDENVLRKAQVKHSLFDTGKNVLRQAMTGLLPPEVANRPKQGFSSPDGAWFRGENASYVRELLLGKRRASAEFISPAYVERIVREHTEQGINHRLLIWSFLSFEWWCRIFLEGEFVGD